MFPAMKLTNYAVLSSTFGFLSSKGLFPKLFQKETKQYHDWWQLKFVSLLQVVTGQNKKAC